MKPYLSFFFLSVSMFVRILPAQEIKTSYRGEMFTSAASGDYTPFWIVNHTWGMVPLRSNNFYIRGGVFHDQSFNKDWSYSFGLDLAASPSPQAYKSVWAQQIYGELNWKSLRLNIGAKEDYTSLLDKNLSSGDYSLSQNARPVPEIKISLPHFLAVPFTNDFLYLKGDFAVGKYLDGDYLERIASPLGNNYTKNTLSHHKSIYLRVGNIEKISNFQFTFGLDHHVQWGGEIYQGRSVYRVPKTFDNFKKIVIGAGAGPNSRFMDAYTVGSHVGNYLLKLDYKTKSEQTYSLYLSHFFEDGSGLKWVNAADMLLGLQYKSNKQEIISGVLIEYFYTKNQSGPIQFIYPSEDGSVNYGGVDGMDDYYNNYDYIQGRSYFGRSLGNPLLLSPEYNGDGKLYFKSNRVMALHGGFEGYFSHELAYRLLITYAESLGRYEIPFPDAKTGVASVFDLTYHCPLASEFDIIGSLGFNTGTFFAGNTFGIALTIRKEGVLFSSKK